MEVTILGGAILLGLLAGGAGLLLGRFVWPSIRGIHPEAFARTQADLERCQQECQNLRARAAELNATCTNAAEQAKVSGEEIARLGERITSLTHRFEEQTAFMHKLESEKSEALLAVTGARAEIATLTEREKTLTQKIVEQTKMLNDMQKQLTAEFENIANRVLKASAAELSANSEKNLTTLLDPFRERLQEFQKKIETTYADEAREVLSLKEHIKLIVETSQAIGTQADDLAKALRGDSQLLGRWGELALERILETAGLQEGREYITQGRGLKLKSEEGGLQKPDVIIQLPEKRSMIIDSKVPLASYERLITAGPDDELALLRQQFTRDVKAHIDNLAGKRYQANPSLQAHDCVLMFIPVEGTLAAALTCEPALLAYAWERHVVLVGPSTLLMTLHTVASIWRYQLQGENAQEIARLAGDLCDKISNSIGDLNMVAEKMRAASEAHGDAVKRLFTGRGNALSIGDRIKALGVKAKQPPNVMIDGLPVAIAAPEDMISDAPPPQDAALGL